jgi:hypothetical protein
MYEGLLLLCVFLSHVPPHWSGTDNQRKNNLETKSNMEETALFSTDEAAFSASQKDLAMCGPWC